MNDVGSGRNELSEGLSKTIKRCERSFFEDDAGPTKKNETHPPALVGPLYPLAGNRIGPILNIAPEKATGGLDKVTGFEKCYKIFLKSVASPYIVEKTELHKFQKLHEK